VGFWRTWSLTPCDVHARAVGLDARQIDGLDEAGADVGRVYNSGYEGGLNQAGTLALVAAESIISTRD